MRIPELIFTAVLSAIMIVVLGGAALAVLVGVLFIPVAFPLTTLGVSVIVVIWLGVAWIKQKRGR